MKTAISQLIDIINSGISILKDNQTKERIILEGVKGEAEKLVAVEKEQILDAYSNGMAEGIIFEAYDNKPESPDDFYKDKYFHTNQ